MSTGSSSSWLPAPSRPVDGVYLYSTGEAVLRRKEVEIAAVPIKRIAEIIQLGEKGYDEQKNGLFVPFVQFPDGRRSFLPSDLADAEEGPLRKLAEECEDPIVRTRLYEVLLARFPSHRRDGAVDWRRRHLLGPARRDRSRPVDARPLRRSSGRRGA